MPERMSEPEANFDFTLQSTDGRIVSFLEWLTPSARKGWEARGFTPQTVTIGEKQRNSDRCAANVPDGPGSKGFVSATSGQ